MMTLRAPAAGLLVAALPLLGAGLPPNLGASVASARPSAAPGAPVPVSYKNVRFLNPLPGARVQAVDVAKVPFNPNEPPGGSAPAHLAFRFSPYYPSVFPPLTVITPTIYVFRTASLAEYKWDGVERRLAAILHTHPDLAPTSPLPLLPELEAAEVFHARAAYVSFQDGQGISYLALHAQDVAPVTANQLFYAYEGLTADGRYYLAAIFPVHVPFLPATPPSNFDYNTFVKGYKRYLRQLVHKLNEPATPRALTPPLPRLNALMASVGIDK
jgi:hypothetical protein